MRGWFMRVPGSMALIWVRTLMWSSTSPGVNSTLAAMA